ncbi:ArsB/NhaD family transporter [Nocardia mexicana]|uniref:SLC13 family permease n=1 Tax=Nocardia mexicana TaxID=279262 RepID=UPI000A079CD4|nr:SLC13 family permease [Nocardia mexicana]
MWLVLAGLGAAVVIGGWLPLVDAVDIELTQAGPILAFLIATTVLAELSDAAGVFDVAAAACARLARGSTAALFGLVAVLSTVVTVVMGLDTTAVLLTPVVLAVTDAVGVAAIPFAMLVVWLANTASLLLPVSNLTNLLAVQHTGVSTIGFAGRMALPALAAVLITVAYLGLLFRRSLTGRYHAPPAAPPPDRLRFIVCTAACGAFAVAVACGVVPWVAATAAAAAAAAPFAMRDRKRLRWSLIPWRPVVAVAGLLLVVGALGAHGMAAVLSGWLGRSDAQATAVAAAMSNLVNNLPAYTAIRSAVPPGDQGRSAAVLVGVNCGPLVTMWGSLATLLWAQRCRARGMTIAPLRFAAIGLGGVPLVLLGAGAALHWS